MNTKTLLIIFATILILSRKVQCLNLNHYKVDKSLAFKTTSQQIYTFDHLKHEQGQNQQENQGSRQNNQGQKQNNQDQDPEQQKKSQFSFLPPELKQFQNQLNKFLQQHQGIDQKLKSQEILSGQDAETLREFLKRDQSINALAIKFSMDPNYQYCFKDLNDEQKIQITKVFINNMVDLNGAFHSDPKFFPSDEQIEAFQKEITANQKLGLEIAACLDIDEIDDDDDDEQQ